MLNLGLRVGEILALEWKDIKMQERLVDINKTVQSNIKNFDSTGNSTYNRVKNSTKTKSGRRILKLNDATIYYIQELMAYDKRNNITSKYIVNIMSNINASLLLYSPVVLYFANATS